jgi:acyl-CoA synthetase
MAVRHPEAGRVAAFPVADDRLGERVCMAVSGTITAAALLAHLRSEGLSKYDMPEYFVRVSEFPLTASGKILKRELILQVQRGQLQPSPVKSLAAARSA